jgi:hypothetical protein
VPAAFLRFNLLLGGQRIEQLLRAGWVDFDFTQRVLTLKDGKGRPGMWVRDHLVPLTDWALAQLAPMRQLNAATPYPFATMSKGDRDKIRMDVTTPSKVVQRISDQLVDEHGPKRSHCPGAQCIHSGPDAPLDQAPFPVDQFLFAQAQQKGWEIDAFLGTLFGPRSSRSSGNGHSSPAWLASWIYLATTPFEILRALDCAHTALGHGFIPVIGKPLHIDHQAAYRGNDVPRLSAK